MANRYIRTNLLQIILRVLVISPCSLIARVINRSLCKRWMNKYITGTIAPITKIIKPGIKPITPKTSPRIPMIVQIRLGRQLKPRFGLRNCAVFSVELSSIQPFFCKLNIFCSRRFMISPFYDFFKSIMNFHIITQKPNNWLFCTVITKE